MTDIHHGDEYLDSFLNYLRTNKHKQIYCTSKPCIDENARVYSLAWLICLQCAADGDAVCTILVQFILSEAPALVMFDQKTAHLEAQKVRLDIVLRALESATVLDCIKSKQAFFTARDPKTRLYVHKSLELLASWYRLVRLVCIRDEAELKDFERRHRGRAQRT